MFNLKQNPVVVMLVLVLSMFVASCSPNTPTEEAISQSPAAETSGGEGVQAATEDVTLTLMFWGNQQAPANWKEVTDAFIADGHENVSFEFIHQPDEYETKLQTLIAANDTPDLFLLNSGHVLRFASEGALLNLDPYFESAGFNVDEEIVAPAIWKWEGNTVGLASEVHAIILFYDKSAFDEAGLEHPPTNVENAWSWDEFVDVACQLTTDTDDLNKRWGVYLAPWMTVWTPFVFSNGGDWFNEDYTEFTLNSPEAVEAIQNMADIRLKQGCAPPLDVADSIGWDVMIQSRRVAMLLDGTWNIPTMMDAWGDDLGLAVLPVYDEYKTMATNDPLSASSKTDHPELAAEFIRFFADPENNPRTLIGIPSAIDYLTGDKQDEWLNAAPRPDGFAEVVGPNLQYSGRTPSLNMPIFSQIEFPIVMPYVLEAFRGERPVQEALDEAKPRVDEVLQQQ